MRASGKLLFPARINELQPLLCIRFKKYETDEVYSLMPVSGLPTTHPESSPLSKVLPRNIMTRTDGSNRWYQTRTVRNPITARSWRHGRGLSRAGYTAPTHRRRQDSSLSSF